MKSVAKPAIAVCFVGLMAATVLFAPATVDARPEYAKAFKSKFTKVKKVDCKICHGDDKKDRNEFGKAVESALGATKVKDAKKIQKAFEKAVKEKSSDGKTFEEKLKNGDRPAADE
jgi:hypothetical protein